MKALQLTEEQRHDLWAEYNDLVQYKSWLAQEQRKGLFPLISRKSSRWLQHSDVTPSVEDFQRAAASLPEDRREELVHKYEVCCCFLFAPSRWWICQLP